MNPLSRYTSLFLLLLMPSNLFGSTPPKAPNDSCRWVLVCYPRRPKMNPQAGFPVHRDTLVIKHETVFHHDHDTIITEKSSFAKVAVGFFAGGLTGYLIGRNHHDNVTYITSCLKHPKKDCK